MQNVAAGRPPPERTSMLKPQASCGSRLLYGPYVRRLVVGQAGRSVGRRRRLDKCRRLSFTIVGLIKGVVAIVASRVKIAWSQMRTKYNTISLSGIAGWP